MFVYLAHISKRALSVLLKNESVKRNERQVGFADNYWENNKNNTWFLHIVKLPQQCQARRGLTARGCSTMLKHLQLKENSERGSMSQIFELTTTRFLLWAVS